MSDELKFFPYKPPIDVGQLEARVGKMLNEIESKRSRYKDSAGSYRNASWGFRILALISVVFFVLATFIWNDEAGKPSPESYALLFLSLAGLFVLADTAFTGTASWARHRLGELLTGDVAENLQLSATAILVDVAQESEIMPPSDVVLKIEEAVKAAQAEMQKIEREELDSWKAGVEAAWQAIKERIDSDRSNIQTAAKEAAAKKDDEEARNKRGALLVSVINADKLESATIAIDDQSTMWEAGTHSKAFPRTAAGHRAVAFAGQTIDGAKFRIEDIVLVKAGTKESLTLTVPG